MRKRFWRILGKLESVNLFKIHYITYIIYSIVWHKYIMKLREEMLNLEINMWKTDQYILQP